MPLDGTVFMLALHGTTPTCEAWTVTPTAMTSGDRRVDYHADHDDLVFEGMHRGEDSAAYCTVKMKVVEDAAGFGVEGARWFRTKAACQAAIAHHAHVAMQWPCDPDDGDSPDPVPATKHRFDDVLAYGAIMYSEGVCNRVRFEASKPAHAASIEGSMSYAIVVDGVHGLESYGYEGQRGDPQMYLLGPGATMEDGSAWGMLCADDVTVTYATDHVGVMGNLYFDRASCQAGTARVRYRESWLPRDAEEAGIGHKPLAGGC